jgi:uncharacterized repeat protein (TIGR02543 family)
VTVYSNWKINSYNVSFEENGGSAVADQSIDYNSPAMKPADPSKTGYTFAGWYSDVALTTPYDFSTPVTGDVTVYANWKINSYTVNFVSNGGSAVSSQTVAYNKFAPKSLSTKKEGYTFKGWYTDSTLKTAYSFAIPVKSNVTLCSVKATVSDVEGNNYTATQKLVVNLPEELNHKYYMAGYPDGTFKPSNSVTRAELAAALVRLIEQQSKRPTITKTTTSFSDVKSTNWFASAVDKVAHYGLMSGYPDGTFQPNKAVTRAEIKAIVIKYVALMNKKYGGLKKIVCPKCKTNYHVDEFNKFLNDQQMSGAPKAFTTTVMTRAEIVKVLNRLFFRGPLTRLKTPSWKDVPTTHWAYYEIQEASRNHETIRLKNDKE